ncbi:hypothetical protein V5G99_05405 [Bibersteinia trehalosi]|uniref:hypothetical protein n=1 Tax=Bibersteinia trehalosi TaxID=47735 RepID=UPI003D2A1131
MLVFWDENGSILSDKEIIQQKLEKYGWISNRIKEFNQNYDILAQKSGYSGTIVRNKHTNDIIIAHKGTQSSQN